MGIGATQALGGDNDLDFVKTGVAMAYGYDRDAKYDTRINLIVVVVVLAYFRTYERS